MSFLKELNNFVHSLEFEATEEELDEFEDLEDGYFFNFSQWCNEKHANDPKFSQVPQRLVKKFDEAITKKFGKFELVETNQKVADGSDIMLVFKFLEQKPSLVAVDTYYSSWDDTDWSEAQFAEVKPKQVTIYEYV
jgi:hypothetical protein